jgi:GNAT superfamily N-acetyltransferase
MSQATPVSASVRLDPATPQDVPELLALIRELAEYEKLLPEVVATEALVHDALFGPRPTAEAVMARCDGAVAGFALFFHNYSTFLGRPGLYLEDLYVRPEYRGEGVGSVLLREMGRIALERNCGRMEWAVLDWNRRAIEFYHAMGARPVDGWTIYRMTGAAIRTLAEGAGVPGKAGSGAA